MATSEINTLPFFYILGRPRSGTTLLRFLFDAHPDVCIPLEGRLIFDLFVPFRQLKEWNESNIDHLLTRLKQVDRIDKWYINYSLLKESLLKHKEMPDYDNLVKLIFSQYQSFYSKNDPLIFGDKNPVYSMFADAILQLIPAARIIYLLRDPRDHILSMMKAGLGNGNMVHMAVQWNRSLKDALVLKEKIPDRIHILKYEEFVADPESHLRMMCSFLNIDFNPAMLQFHQQKDLYADLFKTGGIDDQFHSKLFSPISADHTFRWKKEMSSHDLAVIDFCVKKYADAMSYEPSGCMLSLPEKIKYHSLVSYNSILINRHLNRKNAQIYQYRYDSRR